VGQTIKLARQERLWVFTVLPPVILNLVGLGVFGTYYALAAQRPELVAGIKSGQLAFVVYILLFVLEWALAIAVLLRLKQAGLSLSDFIAPPGSLWKFRWGPALLVFVLLNAIFAVYIARLWASGELQAFGDLAIWQRLFIVALLPVTAGFGEELIWRGYVITQLEARGRGWWSAVLLAAISFALLHGLYLPDKLLVTFLLGIVAGFYFIRERNLIPLMVTHTFLDLWGNGLLLIL